MTKSRLLLRKISNSLYQPFNFGYSSKFVYSLNIMLIQNHSAVRITSALLYTEEWFWCGFDQLTVGHAIPWHSTPTAMILTKMRTESKPDSWPHFWLIAKTGHLHLLDPFLARCLTRSLMRPLVRRTATLHLYPDNLSHEPACVAITSTFIICKGEEREGTGCMLHAEAILRSNLRCAGPMVQISQIQT
jgi:hypothetical protein